jgi:hypothetical protein
MAMVGEEGWRTEAIGSGVAVAILNRLDAVSSLVDEGKYWKASEALYGRRWLDDLDLTGVPTSPLKHAQQWIDAAHDALRTHDVDVHLVQHLLLEARRAIAR